jgi:hypothetical protein
MNRIVNLADFSGTVNANVSFILYIRITPNNDNMHLNYSRAKADPPHFQLTPSVHKCEF